MFIISKNNDNNILNLRIISRIVKKENCIIFYGDDKQPIAAWHFKNIKDMEYDWRYICCMINDYDYKDFRVKN